MKKILGIIGGFGPETTAQFQLAIIERCRANGSLVRPEIIMWNAPIPLKIEANLITKNTNINKFLPFLIRGARTLERGGASMLAMPCNTLHVFIDEIRKAVRIPIMDITQVALKHLTGQHIRNVAIFATEATIMHDIFTSKLKRHGITPIIPTKHEQKAINSVISDILNTKAHRRSTRILRAIASECVARGASDFLLACTDLQIVFPKLTEVRIHDTMHILADACVREIQR